MKVDPVFLHSNYLVEDSNEDEASPDPTQIQLLFVLSLEFFEKDAHIGLSVGIIPLGGEAPGLLR
jgi:hypothetical protein